MNYQTKSIVQRIALLTEDKDPFSFRNKVVISGSSIETNEFDCIQIYVYIQTHLLILSVLDDDNLATSCPGKLLYAPVVWPIVFDIRN